MTAPISDGTERALREGTTRPDGAGTEEWVAAAFFAVAAAFFWWQGFRAFTVAGALLFIVALIQLGVHRRYVADARAMRVPRLGRTLAGATFVVALLFPGLLVLRWLDVAPSLVTLASADVWFGSLLYALGLMELVELATLRALDVL